MGDGPHAVILAAGQGKRMRSALPKVLHPLGGRPFILYVVEAARAATGIPPVVVVALLPLVIVTIRELRLSTLECRNQCRHQVSLAVVALIRHWRYWTTRRLHGCRSEPSCFAEALEPTCLSDTGQQ